MAIEEQHIKTAGASRRTGVPPVQKEKIGVSPVRKRRRGAYLPHWTREGAIYAINFRLADSVPQSVLRAWEAEREDIVRNAERRGTPLTSYEHERLDYLYSEKVERYLHSGKGACWLKDEQIARIVSNALLQFNGERYRLYAWCIMPNHVHVVLQPISECSLPDILHSWKSFTSKEANKILCRKGTFWRTEYYDHLIRNDQDLAHHIEYAWSNPDKAGFRDWKWRWKKDTHERDAHGT